MPVVSLVVSVLDSDFESLELSLPPRLCVVLLPSVSVQPSLPEVPSAPAAVRPRPQVWVAAWLACSLPPWPDPVLWVCVWVCPVLWLVWTLRPSDWVCVMPRLALRFSVRASDSDCPRAWDRLSLVPWVSVRVSLVPRVSVSVSPMPRVWVAPSPSVRPWAVVRVWLVPKVSVVPEPGAFGRAGAAGFGVALRFAGHRRIGGALGNAVPGPRAGRQGFPRAAPIGRAALAEAEIAPRCLLAYSEAIRSSRVWVSITRSRSSAKAVVQNRNSQLREARPRNRFSPCWLAISSSTAPNSPSRVSPFFEWRGSG